MQRKRTVDGRHRSHEMMDDVREPNPEFIVELRAAR